MVGTTEIGENRLTVIDRKTPLGDALTKPPVYVSAVVAKDFCEIDTGIECRRVY